MKKTLIAVVNAHPRQNYQEAQRATWLSSVPPGLDYKFFRGRGATRDPYADEVFLDVDDGYMGLPEKVQAIMRWSFDQGYEFTLKLDDDTLLHPDRFLTSGYDLHDFVGNIIGDGGQLVVPWGFAWSLSRTAMEIIAKEPLPSNNNDEYWVSYALLAKGIRIQSDERYRIHKVGEEALAAPLTRKDGPLPLMISTLRNERPLRAPKRTSPSKDIAVADPRLIALCMFYTQGERLPDEVNIAEMYKVWSRFK